MGIDQSNPARRAILSMIPSFRFFSIMSIYHNNMDLVGNQEESFELQLGL